MANVFQCKYMQATRYRLSATVHSSESRTKYDIFCEQFGHINLDAKLYVTYYKRFTSFARKKEYHLLKKNIN